MQFTTSQIASVDANAGNQFNQTVTVGGTSGSPITYGGLPAVGSGTSSTSTSSSWGLILVVAAAFYFFIVRRS